LLLAQKFVIRIAFAVATWKLIWLNIGIYPIGVFSKIKVSNFFNDE
jgi:hypothetical protein